MRILLSVAAAMLFGRVLYLAGTSLIEWYTVALGRPGGMDGLGAYLLLLLVVFLTTIAMMVVIYSKFYELNMEGLLTGSIVGLWMGKIMTLFPALNVLSAYIDILPLVCLWIGYSLLKQGDICFSGFTLGSVIGFLVSYAIIISLRYAHNSLTSFSYFTTSEILTQTTLVAVGAFIGHFTEKEMRMKHRLR